MQAMLLGDESQPPETVRQTPAPIFQERKLAQKGSTIRPGRLELRRPGRLGLRRPVRWPPYPCPQAASSAGPTR